MKWCSKEGNTSEWWRNRRLRAMSFEMGFSSLGVGLVVSSSA